MSGQVGYTPGPWTADGSYVTCASGVVADIQLNDSAAPYLVRSAETKANARLIAAAPALLETAKEYQKCVQERLNAQQAFRSEDSSENSRWFCVAIDSLRTAEVDLLAAIAKAEGR